MAMTAKEKGIFDQLQTDELALVSNFASSLIRNRTEHTEAYYRFQQARERMLEKNSMSDDEIDAIIHAKETV